MIRLAAFALAAIVTVSAQATPLSILFVGNSYTFGRVAPVLGYNAANVDDMTRPRPDLPDPNFTDTTGSHAYEPHPWGGVPGIFKQLADEAGIAVDVSLSTRNAATLRGHFLNTANGDWDLRSNIAKDKWDIVVLQQGKIIERGTHNELLETKGHYAMLYDLHGDAIISMRMYGRVAEALEAAGLRE